MEDFNEEMKVELVSIIRMHFMAIGRTVPDDRNKSYDLHNLTDSLGNMIKIYMEIDDVNPAMTDFNVKNPHDEPKGKN